MTDTQTKILAAMHTQRRYQAGDLAEMIGSTARATGMALKSLSKLGLAVCEWSPRRRVKVWKLTTEGIVAKKVERVSRLRLEKRIGHGDV